MSPRKKTTKKPLEKKQKEVSEKLQENTQPESPESQVTDSTPPSPEQTETVTSPTDQTAPVAETISVPEPAAPPATEPPIPATSTPPNETQANEEKSPTPNQSSPVIPTIPSPEAHQSTPSVFQPVNLNSPPSENSRSIKKPLIIIGIVLILAGLAGAGYTFMKSRSTATPQSAATAVSPAPTTDVMISPTATPEPVDPAQYKIAVLNGSGAPGEAGRVKAQLEDLGLTVSYTGNADRYDYTDTELFTTGDIPDEVIETIATVLTLKKPESASAPELPPSENADIIIILGAQ